MVINVVNISSTYFITVFRKAKGGQARGSEAEGGEVGLYI